MIRFIPYSQNNCHGYDINLCSYARFFALTGISLFCVITLILLKWCLNMTMQITEKIKNKYFLWKNKINIVKISNTDNNECSICLQTDDNNFVEIKCGHQFHNNCIINSMKSGLMLCPVCKQGIKSEDTINYHNHNEIKNIILV
jgi:hypothetical protein